MRAEKSMSNGGHLIISLDFELLWGLRDLISANNAYKENIRGVHEVMGKTLKLFSKYEINATIAIVGFLFFDSKTDLIQNLPKERPKYLNKKFSPYFGDFEYLIENESELYFAPKLIESIKRHKNHEIGTHTFSHYYCLEKGQNIKQFSSDIKAAMQISVDHGIKVSSIIFPRNQYSQEYIDILKIFNIVCYRGNERSWIYKSASNDNQNMLRRILRFTDSFVNITGHNTFNNEGIGLNYPCNIPSSRFLRPYQHSLCFINKLRIERIKNSMTYAAKKRQNYHLWWHPHNFGKDQFVNLENLKIILEHFKFLSSKYDFQSVTMSNLAKKMSDE